MTFQDHGQESENNVILRSRKMSRFSFPNAPRWGLRFHLSPSAFMEVLMSRTATALPLMVMTTLAACGSGLLESSDVPTSGEDVESQVQRTCPTGTRRFGDLCCAIGTRK